VGLVLCIPVPNSELPNLSFGEKRVLRIGKKKSAISPSPTRLWETCTLRPSCEGFVGPKLINGKFLTIGSISVSWLPQCPPFTDYSIPSIPFRYIADPTQRHPTQIVDSFVTLDGIPISNVKICIRQAQLELTHYGHDHVLQLYNPPPDSRISGNNYIPRTSF